MCLRTVQQGQEKGHCHPCCARIALWASTLPHLGLYSREHWPGFYWRLQPAWSWRRCWAGSRGLWGCPTRTGPCGNSWKTRWGRRDWNRHERCSLRQQAAALKRLLQRRKLRVRALARLTHRPRTWVCGNKKRGSDGVARGPRRLGPVGKSSRQQFGAVGNPALVHVLQRRAVSRKSSPSENDRVSYRLERGEGWRRETRPWTLCEEDRTWAGQAIAAELRRASLLTWANPHSHQTFCRPQPLVWVLGCSVKFSALETLGTSPTEVGRE